MLRLKQRNAAAEAFDGAAVVMKNRRDVARVASATAMSVLVKASPGLTYKPKDKGDTAIDVVDSATRKDALRALYEDRRAELAPAIEKATGQKSLVPIESLLPAAWEVYTLEYAAKGEPIETVASLKELGGYARGLIGDELTRLSDRLDELRDLANEPALSGIGPNQSVTYRGLNSTERNELQQMADYLVKIQRTAEKGRRASQALGGTPENWDTLLADCAVARDTAQQAYERRY